MTTFSAKTDRVIVLGSVNSRVQQQGYTRTLCFSVNEQQRFVDISLTQNQLKELKHLLEVDEFTAGEDAVREAARVAAREKRERTIAVQKQRHAKRLRYPDLDNTIGF